MRLGDLDALKKAFIEWTGDSDTLVYAHTIYSLIDNAPTVEPQKVVTIPHELIEKLVLCVVDTVENIDWDKAIEAYKERPQGKWITDDFHNTICNMCGGIRRDNRVEYIAFCNKCGADMRGGAE